MGNIFAEFEELQMTEAANRELLHYLPKMLDRAKAQKRSLLDRIKHVLTLTERFPQAKLKNQIEQLSFHLEKAMVMQNSSEGLIETALILVEKEIDKLTEARIRAGDPLVQKKKQATCN